MELLSLLLILAIGIHWFNTQGQRKRTALLAEQLRPYQIEKHMEQLTSAYMRALGESDLSRQTRGFKIALPFVDQLSPKATFDMRKMLQTHAKGIEQAVENRAGLPLKERAFRLMGEMFLMQHSCHWFCKSKTIASARMVARHQTRYEQALQAVSPETRQAYLAVIEA